MGVRAEDEGLEVRCEYCFEPRRGRKMAKRHMTFSNSEFYAYVCDSRCGELWQKQMRIEHERVILAMNRRDGGMVDTLVSNTSGASRVGSNPSPGTKVAV